MQVHFTSLNRIASNSQVAHSFREAVYTRRFTKWEAMGNHNLHPIARMRETMVGIWAEIIDIKIAGVKISWLFRPRQGRQCNGSKPTSRCRLNTDLPVYQACNRLPTSLIWRLSETLQITMVAKSHPKQCHTRIIHKTRSHI